MKLAHIADPHLGIRQYHRQTPAGINQREADVANAFRAAIDGVIATRPDAVVVAGDLFHSVRPTNYAIVFAFRQFQRLRDALPDAPIVLIAGNHDTPRTVEIGSILRLFEELGIDVATDEPRRLVYPELDLSIFAIPRQAILSAEPPLLQPEGPQKYQVLLAHFEVEGEYPTGHVATEYSGAVVSSREMHLRDWTYVALGHYHTQHEVAKNAWYAGALEYIGPNIWGERIDEIEHGDHGKGWLLTDLDSGKIKRQRVPPTREVYDLKPIDAEGESAASIDATIAERIAAIPGGIRDQIVRLRVYEIPRHIVRELNHAAIRGFKAEALHFHLDLRRPEIHRTLGVGSPGRRQTLSELVASYLSGRPLPAELDREAFVRLGHELMESVERDLVGS
ncbi:MAG TPA: exonuclease SbcCD subunit D [Gemmatimonadales bacterium]|nr:exonuclease SbcCD subunit D [Gemmatimonadales bacterium]